ncbi:GspE/PulE family protein [Rhodoferax sp.]|uniref:GspE/PulE family protein n=1 Tax=Rhodoferax sp. TaxID=50421 RepID=UPI002ACDB335|nr:ATPase, T2SS/T4P/T4SS family [Rhodoferax sp.]
MCDLDISERRKPQDGKIKFKKYGPLDIELRVATIPSAGGVEDVVMRILAAGEPIPLEKLGLTAHNKARLEATVSKPYGLFYVCGPTGSGKTTTLHSILKFLNTPDTKIWTAEDPVEITQKGLRQVQINKKAGIDFALVMRAFLRADPDIIMVGESRDKETVSMGVEASLTGHMVFSTLHTNSAPESITRLLDMGMDPFNFADALLGILAQRLAKKLCDCKQAYVPDAEELRLFAAEYAEELTPLPSMESRLRWRIPKDDGQMAANLWRRRPAQVVQSSGLRQVQQDGLQRPGWLARADGGGRRCKEAYSGARARGGAVFRCRGGRYAHPEDGWHGEGHDGADGSQDGQAGVYQVIDTLRTTKM